MRARVLSEQPCCAVCGAPATEVHHLVPVAQGGMNDRANLVALCHACHARITVEQQRHARHAQRVQRVGGAKSSAGAARRPAPHLEKFPFEIRGKLRGRLRSAENRTKLQ